MSDLFHDGTMDAFIYLCIWISVFHLSLSSSSCLEKMVLLYRTYIVTFSFISYLCVYDIHQAIHTLWHGPTFADDRTINNTLRNRSWSTGTGLLMSPRSRTSAHQAVESKSGLKLMFVLKSVATHPLSDFEFGVTIFWKSSFFIRNLY